jgi:hypothetical protein
LADEKSAAGWNREPMEYGVIYIVLKRNMKNRRI